MTCEQAVPAAAKMMPVASPATQCTVEPTPCFHSGFGDLALEQAQVEAPLAEVISQCGKDLRVFVG